MEFKVIQRDHWFPEEGRDTAYLKIDYWNDFSYVTMFQIQLFDELSNKHDLGSLKIGFRGQTKEKSTFGQLDSTFIELSDQFFSLGLDVDYYRKISNLSEETKRSLLTGLRDIVNNLEIVDAILEEDVFKVSLLRDVSLSVIHGQFRRVLDGGVPLTDFTFSYRVPEGERTAGISLDFEVVASSKPSTNIHAIIARNGVGKTTILNGMTEAIVYREQSVSRFYQVTSGPFARETPIDNLYFSALVSVSFSVFDPFAPPQEQNDPTKGACYFHIGLKETDPEGGTRVKSLEELRYEFVDAVSMIVIQREKRARWLKAVATLESDENFADMQLGSLVEKTGEELKTQALSDIERMSSGHAIVIHTITRLIIAVEEKTLVLIDEPESHLHPPLLSAFTRALSELLYDRNGVAIIATHSPVVLQEIPASCVWLIERSRLVMEWRRPESETFGENVGTLTREVFGLEVFKSGFIKLLKESVETGESYESILASYGGTLGWEGRGILKALVLSRDRDLEIEE